MEEFALGAGFTAEALFELISQYIAVVIILWAAWIGVGAFQSWYAGTLQARQLLTYGVRAAIMVIVILWLLAV